MPAHASTAVRAEHVARRCLAPRPVLPAAGSSLRAAPPLPRFFSRAGRQPAAAAVSLPPTSPPPPASPAPALFSRRWPGHVEVPQLPTAPWAPAHPPVQPSSRCAAPLPCRSTRSSLAPLHQDTHACTPASPDCTRLELAALCYPGGPTAQPALRQRF